jgi:alkanesulfonate monooxygenase SsuD/methylene tetrahydromethanopterin reductase-like flavin-dependent oxidoreductase (luciferase family)
MIDEIGLLDVRSGGRAVIGIGSGYQKFEFDRFQKLINKSAVSMEIWDILEMALREGAVDYAGKFFSVPPTPVAIKPLQRPAPEIFVTGLEPAVVQRMARSGHTLLSRRWPWTCATILPRQLAATAR